MATQRYIHTKFWSDSYIEKLDPVEKLLFIYLMTNERTNLAGIYELPVKFMSVETGIERSMVENILARFEKDGKVVMYNGWVRLVNFVKHQQLNNSKITTGIDKILEDLPEEIVKGLHLDDDSLSIAYVSPIDEQSHIIKSNLIKSNKIKEKENAKALSNPLDEEAKRLAVKLHSAVKQRYNFTKERPTEINYSYDAIEKLHRIDGYDYFFIEKVMDWSQQHDFWQRNILSGKKLRQNFNKLMIDAKFESDNKTSRVVIAGQGNGTNGL